MRVVSAPDPRFTRSGSDIWHEEIIPVFDAVLGTTLRLPPEFHRAGKGDLLVRIMVKIPKHIGPEEKELYEQLRALSADSPLKR